MNREDMTLFYSEKQNNGYLSNWYVCDFEVDGIKYTSSEQYMMHQKALIFHDIVIADKILEQKATDLKKIKDLGRKVKGFDSKVWDAHKRQVMFDGLYAKFSQNADLKELLLSTGDTIIVECSPWDKIWGIGMRKSDERCYDPDQWEGQNLLGFALMDVRSALKATE